MAKSKEIDPVKFAKLVAKNTRLPLPRVAQVFQKHPLTPAGYKKAIDECKVLAAREVEMIMKKIAPF